MDSVASHVNQTILKKSNRFVTTLQSQGFQIQYAYLYGSYAKGHARPDSDIDIAIVSQDLSGDWLDDYCRLTRIADDIDTRMEVVPFLPKDFHEKNPLVWEIKSFGVPLTGNIKRRAIKRKSVSRTRRK